MPNTENGITIIGSGMAGFSAGIYAARAGNNPLIIRGDEPGGQLTLTTEVENYPGFPDGISGPDLISRLESQATKFGCDIRNGTVTNIDAGDVFTVTLNNGDTVTSDSVIAASGSSARMLNIPGEEELTGYGVSTCATCDGAFFKDSDMVVVGGGDAAFEEAHFLTRFADTVTLVHRRDEFRAEQYWQEKVQRKVEDGDIEIVTNTELKEIHGSRDSGVEYVSVVTHPDGHPSQKLSANQTEHWTIDVDAVFIAIGHVPNTDYLTDTRVELDAGGYIDTQDGQGAESTATDVPGLFAAGDVVDHHYQQAATAAAMGVRAALDADHYLSQKQ